MKSFTYLIYIVLWWGLLVGGCGYIVFWKDHSPWWFALAFTIVYTCTYSPGQWIHGYGARDEE